MIKFQQPNSKAEKKSNLGIEGFQAEWQSELSCFHLKGKSSDAAKNWHMVSHSTLTEQNTCCVRSLWPHHPVLIQATEGF